MPFTRDTESVIRQVLEALELAESPSPEEVLSRLEHLQRALAPEQEFALILSWLGRCRLVHRLGQEQLPIASIDAYRVPDLLAVFDASTGLLPTLVEVKTTGGPTGNMELKATLRLKAQQLRYAELLGLPLLVAWRNGSMWTLFDATRMSLAKTNYRIDFVTALKENLLGSLAGDFAYRVLPGSAVKMVIERLGPVDPTTGGFEGVIRRVRITNPEGDEVPNIPHLSSLFLVWESEVVLDEREAEVVQSFVIPGPPDMEFASQTFTRLVHAMAGLSGREVNWRGIAHDGAHFAHDVERLRRVVEEASRFGVTEPLFVQRPVTKPSFL